MTKDSKDSQVKEVRSFAFELRDSADGQPGKTLVGYAALYDSPSIDLGGFVEVVKPSAFAASLSPDCDIKCLYSHDSSAVLGRTPNTLKLSSDNQGLYFDLDIPDTTHGRDLVELVARGDVTQCSFGFVCLQDNWVDRGETELPLRELLAVELLEISVAVAFPAYPLTSVSLRTMPNDLWNRHIDNWLEEQRAMLAIIRTQLAKYEVSGLDSNG